MNTDIQKTDIEQVLQEMEKIINVMEQQEIKKQQTRARVLRSIMRPILHIIAKMLSFGVTVLYMLFSSIALILLIMLVVSTIQSVAGLQHDSIESILLCVVAGGIAVYAFITETQRNTKKFAVYAEKMHRHIQEV